ncbi:MAG: TIGR03936 family radical SAM-associated protein [Spirochaetes bacterium]|nr:TIGR03936 family radical SAM-associated protein [Spirochaetota bacterium]
MSNHALRIIYSGLNALDGIRCERAFTPAPDFETLLRSSGVPLYTLESGTVLADADIVAFSLGFELSAINVITMLDLGGVPLRAAERRESHPLVIAGGPVASNPLPLSPFIDAFWIGEAEGGFYELIRELAVMKGHGGSREESIRRLAREDAIWMPGKKAIRAVFGGFSESQYETALPIPVVKPVQEHGVVEIMRGCPNGCRFCHAGYYYRPQRCKQPVKIFGEIENLVSRGGFRQITLSSLSSGDYPDIAGLVRFLNSKYRGRGISFQLPSLKVETFSLEALESLSEVRKGGLTFAIETPEKAGQIAINKLVTAERTKAIIAEARKHGYRVIKFYFMIGLPLQVDPVRETDAIVDFMSGIASDGAIQVNLTVGIFVPKPHTPFQWAEQLDERSGMAGINRIRSGLKSRRNIKISWHSPFLSVIEGIFARGDERVGELILKAWKRGARLDAWEEYFRKDVWHSVLVEQPFALDFLKAKDVDASLPWDGISIRVSTSYLRNEELRSKQSIITSGCIENCKERCGSCSDGLGIVQNSIHGKDFPIPDYVSELSSKQSARMLFRFRKEGRSSYIAHHTVGELLFRAFSIGKIPVSYSEGFNPLPRLDLGNPLPLGVPSSSEYGLVSLYAAIGERDFLVGTNSSLPEGMELIDTCLLAYPDNTKIISLGSVWRGADYLLTFNDEESCSSAFKILARLSADRNWSMHMEKTGPCIIARLADPDKLAIVPSLRIFLDEALLAHAFTFKPSTLRIQQYASDGNSLVDLLGFFKKRGY